ncbi:SCAMP family protein isoform 4 [Hibiscus syriacus]|uniref:SCAMP family protein isoform 4 n=1 Tax=Hibiscus syriacus TaxID=106335 RepID=A0A6A3CT57_HIBSY|nr:SCAMP family protein isoform 4 [Hibiscus syriacus]
MSLGTDVTRVNGGVVGPARPLASEPLGFGQKHDATVDIPLDTMNDSKKREKDLAAWEADLKRREKDIKGREDAVSQCKRTGAQETVYLYFLFKCSGRVESDTEEENIGDCETDEEEDDDIPLDDDDED